MLRRRKHRHGPGIPGGRRPASWLTATTLATSLAVVGLWGGPGAAVAAADAGSGPLIAFTLNGELYVAQPDGSDPRQVPTGYGAVDPVWSPDGTRIFFIAGGTSEIASVRPDGTGLLLVESNVPTQPFALDPQGRYVVAGNGETAYADGSQPDFGTRITSPTGPISAATIDPATGQLIAEIGSSLDAVGDGTTTVLVPAARNGAGAFAISPDGSELAFVGIAVSGTRSFNEIFTERLSYSGSGTAAVLTAPAAAPVQLGTDFACTQSLSWTSDGSAVTAYCTNSKTYELLPTDGSTPVTLAVPTDTTVPTAPGPIAYQTAATSQAALQPAIQIPYASRLPSAATPVSERDGLIAYLHGGQIVVAKADGSDRRTIFLATDGADPARLELHWAPDGSRIYFLATSGGHDYDDNAVYSIRPDGTGLTLIGGTRPPVGFALDATGAYTETAHIVNEVLAAPSDPKGSLTGFSMGVGLAHLGGSEPTAMAADPLDNETFIVLSGDLYAVGGGGQAAELLTGDQISSVAVSPDGTALAYRAVDSSGTAHDYVDQIEYSGSGAQSLITGLADSPVSLASGSAAGDIEQWTPDGADLLLRQPMADGGYAWENLPLAGGPSTPVAGESDDAYVQYQPVTAATGPDPVWHVARLWGGTAIDTAVAVSQYSYDAAATATGNRQAKAVVLSRSDAYYDALAGSMLAAEKQAPLLLTPPTGLDPRAEAEIQRVLAPGGTVYVLGGTAAISPAVTAALTTLGYKPDRLAGTTMYGTAVAIDNTMTTTPARIVVATGKSYYDALSSSTLAAQPGTVLVLSDGTTLNPDSKTYLSAHTGGAACGRAPDYIVGVGGPGVQALDEGLDNGSVKCGFTPLVGDNAKDTAIEVAQSEAYLAEDGNGGPTRVGFATTAGWYDALAGGAMIGHDGGSLLLTDPTSLYGPDTQYLADIDGGQADIVGGQTAAEADIFGGPAALPAALQNPIGAALSQGWTWDYTSFEPGDPVPPFELN